MNKRTAHSIDIDHARRIYRACRADYCRREDCAAAEFDDHVASLADNLYEWDRPAAMLAVAVEQYAMKYTTTHTDSPTWTWRFSPPGARA